MFVVRSITTAGYRQPIRSILIDEVVAEVKLSESETDDLQNINSSLLTTRHPPGNLWTGVGWWNISSRILLIAHTRVDLSAVLKSLVMTCIALVTKSYSITVTRLIVAVWEEIIRLLERLVRSVAGVGALSVPCVLLVTRTLLSVLP